MDRANRIKEIIEYKQRRLDELADPNEWERITKNMECGEYKEFKQHCIDEEIIIAALREQEQSKWISDRLPTEEENEGVIIGIVNGNNGIITFTDAEIFVRYDFEEKAWWSVDYDIEGCKVKCWYLLPEPPKEGAEG